MQLVNLRNRVALILGSYAFTIPIVSLIHEIGHIIAMQSVGITQYRLVINPLAESYAMPLVTLPAEHMLFISSFGMVFQTIVFAIIGIALWRKRSTLLLPLMMCLPMSLINVGSYLLMGAIEEGSDVVLIAEAGAPVLIIQVSGIITLILGIWTFAQLLPLAGFSKNDPRIDIFLPLVLATGLYSVTMLAYGYLTGNGTLIGSINVVFSVITGLVYTWILKRSKLIQANIPTSIDSYKVLGIGLTAVLLCFLIF